MIHGLTRGYSGIVYIYYRGPMRVVLSDMNAGYSNSRATDTALRIVLNPFDWTEVDFSFIKDRWESGESQLSYLERDGLVDIYTDVNEVKLLKDRLSKNNISAREAAKEGVFVSNWEDIKEKEAHALNKPSFISENTTHLAGTAETNAVDSCDGFNICTPVQTKNSTYFDLNSLSRLSNCEQNQGPVETIHNVNTNNSELSDLITVIKNQSENTSKQLDQLAKVMEGMQQLIALTLANANKKGN